MKILGKYFKRWRKTKLLPKPETLVMSFHGHPEYRICDADLCCAKCMIDRPYHYTC